MTSPRYNSDDFWHRTTTTGVLEHHSVLTVPPQMQSKKQVTGVQLSPAFPVLSSRINSLRNMECLWSEIETKLLSCVHKDLLMSLKPKHMTLETLANGKMKAENLGKNGRRKCGTTKESNEDNDNNDNTSL